MTSYDFENISLEKFVCYCIESLAKLPETDVDHYRCMSKEGFFYCVFVEGWKSSEILFELEQVKNEYIKEIKYIEDLKPEIEELKKEIERLEKEQRMTCVYAPPEFLDGFSLL